MEPTTKGSGAASLMLPLLALGCSLLAVVILAASGFGVRFGLWQFRTGFDILKWAALLGLASALFALLAGTASLKKRSTGGAVLSLCALLIGLVAFGVPYSWKLKAKSYPRIHDISTDLDNPPNFVAIAGLRQGLIVYGGAAVAVQQLRAYPELKTLVLSVPMQQAFQAALDTAREMGWRIVAQVPAEGRIEATDTTFWYGFKDDVAIRISPAAGGDRSLVDIRSVSRVGISDIGTNARRVRAFLAKMSHQAPDKK